MDFPFTIPEDSMFNDGFDGFDVSIPASPAVPVYQQIQQFSYPQIPQAQQPAVYQQIQQFFPIPQIQQPEQDRRQRKINQYFKPAPQQQEEEPAPQPDTSSLEAALTTAVERYSSSEELSSRPSSPSSSSANNSESETELSSTESDLSLSSASTSSPEEDPAPAPQEEYEENRRVLLHDLPLRYTTEDVYSYIVQQGFIPITVEQVPNKNAVYITFNSGTDAENFVIKVQEQNNGIHARLAARPFKEDPEVRQYRRLNAPTPNDTRSIANYFNREYISTDRANAVIPSYAVPAARSTRAENYGRSIGRKILASKCQCNGVKYIGRDDKGEPLFAAQWNETVESMASFIGVDWCWFFAQMIDVDDRTMQCLYSRFQKVNNPPNGLRRWPETPEEAFRQSFLEYTSREDHDQMVANTCQKVKEQLDFERREEAEEFYSRKGKIGKKSRRIY